MKINIKEINKEDLILLIENCSYIELFKLVKSEYILEKIVKEDLFWSYIVPNKIISDRRICSFMEYIYKYDKNYVLSKIEEITKYYCSDYVFYLLNRIFEKNNISINHLINKMIDKQIKVSYNYLVYILLKNKEGKDLLINNIDLFISGNDKLIQLKKILNRNKINSNINEVMDNNPQIIINEIMTSPLHLKKYDFSEEKIYDMIKIMIDELLNYENKKYHDIEKVGEGDFSCVFGLGNKIFKIGDERMFFTIPDNKRYLKPLYRQEIKSIINEDTLFCIEITEKVDTKSVTDTDVCNIYCELRDQGLIWRDAKKDNIGRLLKDNEVYFDGVKPTKEAVSMISQTDEVLKKGDIVIIDNDYIYTEEEYKKRNKYKHNLSLIANIYEEKGIRNYECNYQYKKVNKNE